MLNARQRRFVAEYLIDLNAAGAARRAGYSARSAGKLMKKEEIREAIGAELEAVRSDRIAEAREVMEYLTSVLRGETEPEGRGEGDPEGGQRKPPTVQERLRAAELLGKRLGMFRDQVDLLGAAPVVICGSEELED